MSELFLDEIYESAFLPEKWPEKLDTMSEMAGAVGGSLFLVNGNVQNWTASPGLREPMAAYANSNILTKPGFRPRLFDTGQFKFVDDYASYTDAEMAQHPMYRDILYPRGLGFSARTVFALPTGDLMVVALERARSKGPVEAEAIEKLNVIRPHIARAALMAARMHLERAKAVTQVLGALGLPGLMFDANYRVHGTNHLIETLAEIRFDAFDKITLTDPRADLIFKNAAAHIAASSHASPYSFPVTGADGIPTKVAHVIPVCGEASDIFVRGIGVLILTPVNSERIPSIGLIQSLFDFTATEARVAQHIAKGDTVEKIAQSNDVSVNTVRTQVRQIMDKTGCHRQLEIANLFTRLAVVPQPENHKST